MNVEPDRPKFVVIRLAQFHFGHPVKNFTRIQVAKDPSLKLQQKRRVNRVTEIQKRVWAGESIKQRSFRHSDTTYRVELMRTRRWFLIEQTIATSQSMRAELPLEVVNPGLIGPLVIRGRQQLEPDSIELQSPQAEHPLQRHGKISAAFAIFCGKAASEENRHASRILILPACSSMNTDRS
jgi:hypothetical protein